MDVLPDTQTLHVDNIVFSQGNNLEVWGRLYSTKKNYKSLELTENLVTCGRAPTCSIPITLNEAKPDIFFAISKIHFRIIREEYQPTIVYIEDTSANGTFINKDKLGKGKKRILQNNDEISIASPNYRVYVFMDVGTPDNLIFPEEIRSRYTVSRLLGSGACGDVHLVFEKNTFKRFAMKTIIKKMPGNNNACHPNSVQQVQNEIKILKAVNHPCCIKVEDIVDTPDSAHIVLELMEAELFDRIKQFSQLREPDAKFIFFQIVLGVQYLHSQGITHRDLKPDNILLTTSADSPEPRIKISDFGLSKVVASASMMKTRCGTLLYVAPEVLKTRGELSYTKKVDIWSMGIILFVCLGGYPPFNPDLKEPLSDQIIGGNISFPARYWNGVSPEAIDLIRRMLTVNPELRITIDGILNHPWLQDNDVREKLSNFNLVEDCDETLQNEDDASTLDITPSPKRRKQS